MKNVIRAAPILVALALFLSVLGIVQQTQSGTALAAEGTLNIRASTSTTSTALSFATFNRSVGVIVVDSDLDGDGTLAVSVLSTSDSTGITLTLNESPTGTFSALLKIATTTSTSTAPAVIKTADGDTVTVNYTDASLGVTTPATLTVETGKPTISSLSPSSGTITKVASHTLSVDVTDSQSSIDLSTIKFLFSTAASIGTSTVPITAISPSITSAIDNGYTASRSFTFSEGVTWIGVKVSDGAGNESVFDADTSTSSVNDGNTVTYDATPPSISTVTTGNYWDSVTKTVLKNRRTSLEIEFTDALLNLDPASILPTDFAVAGTTVTAADIFSASTEKPKSVFLTVEDDIAPDAKPVVTIVGDGVTDQAGNVLANVNKTAIDGIAPLLTVTLSSALASKDDQVEITVVSDEDLASAPVVVVLTAESSVAASTAVTATSTQTITAVPSIASNTWVATTAKTNKTGLMNVSVSATDKAATANTATMGVVGNTDADTASAITYESDINLPSPTITPATGTSPVTRDPYFITIDFALEGTENNDDSHATVTITSFTYDGTDMLSSVTSEDNIKFLVAISGITTAEHTVTVNAIDAAGNVLAADASSTFTITERAAIKIPIQPGWNLVSLPGSPSDTAINTVLANNAEISAVVSYDAALPGGFLSAVRDVDGTFSGTLTTIDATKGYWMLSSVFKNLEVDVSPLAAGHAGVLPPSIPVSKGWNLVPVVDISGTIAAGSAKDTATDYFASLGTTVTRIYTFDTVLNQWQLKVGSDNVLVGKAYWIFATAAGTLAP